MQTDIYKDALKRGQKEYAKAVSKGSYPYLTALDYLLENNEPGNILSMGRIQIPLDFVVGTKNDARGRSFSRGFMPLLEEDSEFAAKWNLLCEAQVEEGIRDPIKVYEYLNRYYVEEGNKRVSVMKYFGAADILAEVTRIYPSDLDGEEYGDYRAIIEFQKITGIYTLEFAGKESYRELLKIIGRESSSCWDEDTRREFINSFYFFDRIYKALSFKFSKINSADGMLEYIRIYGMKSIDKGEEQLIKTRLEKMEGELQLLDKGEAGSVNEYPEERKAGLFQSVIGTGIIKAKKIGFVHDKTPKESGWTNNHELGRSHVESVFGGRIKTEVYFNGCDNPEAVIEKAIADGCDVIFTTSPKLMAASLKCALEHPDVTIFNCSVNTQHSQVVNYYARMYEVKFILGAIAAALSDGGRLGYICNYPIWGQIAGINAFALGARMVRPDISIDLEWTGHKTLQEVVTTLQERGIAIISSIENVHMNQPDYGYFGLFKINGGERESIAAPLWQWDVYYEEIIRRMLNGSFHKDYTESNHALSYYWGMSAGVLDILYGKGISEYTIKLGNIIREGIKSGNINIFSGVISTHSAGSFCVDEPGLEIDQIVTMDYLMDNINGHIPTYDELSRDVRETVDIMGIKTVIGGK